MTEPRVRADFFNAGVLYRFATEAYTAGLAQGSWSRQHIVSIVFAAMALEAFLNEVAGLAADPSLHDGRSRPPIEALADALHEVEDQRGSVELKLQVVFVVLTGACLDRGAAPFQDVDLLFQLRNALVHMKLDTRTGSTEAEVIGKVPSLIRKLAAKGAASANDLSAMTSWTTLICTPKLAWWACNTAAQVVERVVQASPSSDFRRQLERSFLREMQAPSPPAG